MITSTQPRPTSFLLALVILALTALSPTLASAQTEPPSASSPLEREAANASAPSSTDSREASASAPHDGSVAGAGTKKATPRRAVVGSPTPEVVEASAQPFESEVLPTVAPAAESDQTGTAILDAGAADADAGDAGTADSDADAGPPTDAGTAESTTPAETPPVTADAHGTAAPSPAANPEQASGSSAATQPPAYPLMPFWPFMPEPQRTTPEPSDYADHGDRTVVLLPDFDAFGRFFPELPQGGVLSALSTFLLLVFAMGLARQIRSYREKLPDRGLFPGLVSLTNILLRLAALTLFVSIVAQLMPPALAKALPWVLIAAAGAVGWSARDFLPDVTAAIVIAFERRIRPGVWLSGSSFQGVVEGRGLRAIWIRDGRGQRIAVPNRRLLSEPITTHTSSGSVHDVSLRLETTAPASEVRRALIDAVLASPWTQPYFTPTIRRDGKAPEIWHVRTNLLDVGFAMQFEGQLLERVEEMLAGRRASSSSTIIETPAV